MLIVSYDISDDKLRTKFAKYLEKYGSRMQCSVFRIKNSSYVLQNITYDIENKFKTRFQESDSVLIFQLSETCKITRYGHNAHDDEDSLFIV